MQNTDFLAVQEYFRTLQQQSLFLNDFVGIFEREYFEKSASYEGLKSPALVMFRYELGYESQGQNTLAVRKIGFAILLNDIAADDIPAQYEGVSRAEQLANKVLARLRFDSADRNHAMFNSYMPETVQIEPVELDAANFGVDVFLSLKNPQRMNMDPTDWQDIDNICP